jgi:hypothetical protein
VNSSAAKLIWLPRGVCILYLLFLLVSVITDIIVGTGYGGAAVLAALPITVLVFILFQFWDKPLYSGVCYALAGLAWSLFTLRTDFLSWIFLAAPLLFSGLAFLLCWNLERQYTFFD